MKLKGEKELLAEEMYCNVENELYNIIKSETHKIGNLCKSIEDVENEEITNKLENINNSNSFIYMCRKVAEIILQGDFTLDEIRILYYYSEEYKLIKILAEVIEEHKESVNVNNTEMVVNFIKNMLILKIKDRK